MLGFRISFYCDIRFIPYFLPGFPVLLFQNVPAQAFGFARFRYGFLYQVLPFIIKGRRDADIFDERCGIARFHLDAYAESGLFLFFYAYGVGKCLFIVLEEPVGHGIACLCVFPPGLCPQIGTITGSAGSEDIPYLFIRMLGMLRNVSVESRYEGNFPCIVKGGNTVFDKAEVGTGHIGNMFYVQAELVAAWRGHLYIAVGDARLHVETPVKAVHVPLGQVQFFVDEAQADAAPFRSIGNTRIKLWKTVFPPVHAGLV